MKLETRIRRAFLLRYGIKAKISEGVVSAPGFLPTRIEEWTTEKTEAGNVRLLCLKNQVFKFCK